MLGSRSKSKRIYKEDLPADLQKVYDSVIMGSIAPELILKEQNSPARKKIKKGRYDEKLSTLLEYFIGQMYLGQHEQGYDYKPALATLEQIIDQKDNLSDDQIELVNTQYHEHKVYIMVSEKLQEFETLIRNLNDEKINQENQNSPPVAITNQNALIIGQLISKEYTKAATNIKKINIKNLEYIYQGFSRIILQQPELRALFQSISTVHPILRCYQFEAALDKGDYESACADFCVLIQSQEGISYLGRQKLPQYYADLSNLLKEKETSDARKNLAKIKHMGSSDPYYLKHYYYNQSLLARPSDRHKAVIYLLKCIKILYGLLEFECYEMSASEAGKEIHQHIKYIESFHRPEFDHALTALKQHFIRTGYFKNIPSDLRTNQDDSFIHPTFYTEDERLEIFMKFTKSISKTVITAPSLSLASAASTEAKTAISVATASHTKARIIHNNN